MKNLKNLNKLPRWRFRFLLVSALLISLLAWKSSAATTPITTLDQEVAEEVELELTSADLDAGMEAIEQELALKSDEQLAQEIHALADSFRSAADEPSLTPEQKNVLLHASEVLRTQANDPIQKPRQRILQSWKKCFDGLKKTVGYLARGTAYAAVAVNQTVSIPFRIVYKFFRGLITGKAKRPHQPIVFDSVSLNILFIGGFLYKGIPDLIRVLANPAAIFLDATNAAFGTFIIGFPFLTNFFAIDLTARFVCQRKLAKSTNPRFQRFCKNLGKMYQFGAKASGIGDRGGAAIHGLFRKKQTVTP